jgi:hypothetical protein
MKIFVAEAYGLHSKIELISNKVGLFQEPISEKLFTEVKTIESSDAVLVPHDAYYFHKFPDYLNYLNALSKSKLVIFSDRGDFPKRPKITNSVALRVAINPGESRFRKIVIPYNVESLSFLPYKKLEANPTISFVGFMPKLSLGRFKHALQQSPLHPVKGNGAVVRRLMDRTLSKADITYSCISRNSYGALDVGQNDLAKNRAEYLGSINESDLVACPRGDANQSARFYEALSAGRIPCVPDTSIVFPNVEEAKLNNLLIKFPFRHKILEFLVEEYFKSIRTQSDYNSIQRDLRDFFQRNLRFEPIVKNIFTSDTNSFKTMANFI